MVREKIKYKKKTNIKLTKYQIDLDEARFGDLTLWKKLQDSDA